MNTLKWLMKREFWEHRGGFFWAPVVTAGVFFTFALMGVITAQVFKRHFFGEMKIGISLQKMTEQMSPEDLAQLGPAIDLGLLGYGSVIQLVLGFVLFFYLLGSLYDDRRDRSVLFWKSMPISDAQTVLSKVISATVIAPVIALAASIALQLGALLLGSLFLLLHGVSPITMIWGPAEPLSVWFKMIATLPINALWALPTIGWLMMVSAYARSKPFLWATLLPIGVGVLASWFDVLSTFSIPDYKVWQYGIAHLLGGVFPGFYEVQFGPSEFVKGVEVAGLAGASSWSRLGEVLISPSMWIGVVAGVAMLFAATRLRRWRDEA